MSTITLAEAKKLGLDMLIEGVIDHIVEVNPIYNVLPFMSIAGNALVFNRETTLGDVGSYAIGATIAAKTPGARTKVTAELASIIGDAEVNKLLQAQRVGGNIAEVEMRSKARNVGRKFQDLMINGDVDNNDATVQEFDGLIQICTDLGGDQWTDLGGALTLAAMDEMCDAVKSGGGLADFIVMSARTRREYKALLRALGGTDGEYVEIAGLRMLMHDGVPIYRNDFVPENLTLSGGTGESVVFAGNFDDGTGKVGIAGLTAADAMGVHVEEVGAKETKDEDIYRVKFYSGFTCFHSKGISGLYGVGGTPA